MTAPRIGCFGKLPAHGDFIDRALPQSFIQPWDEWLQGVMASSRELLGADWLKRYMVGPIWRFALAPGLCGSNGWRGLLMPSVDRVNRYYPLTIAMPEFADVSPLSAMVSCTDWFSNCEEAALSALQPGVDADKLEALLAAIEPTRPLRPRVPCPRFAGDSAAAWQFQLPRNPDSAPLDIIIAEALMKQDYPHSSLWRSAGSDAVEPSLLIHRGLPSMHDFAALLDGKWKQWGWASCRVESVDEAQCMRQQDGESLP